MITLEMLEKARVKYRFDKYVWITHKGSFLANRSCLVGITSEGRVVWCSWSYENIHEFFSDAVAGGRLYMSSYFLQDKNLLDGSVINGVEILSVKIFETDEECLEHFKDMLFMEELAK